MSERALNAAFELRSSIASNVVWTGLDAAVAAANAVAEVQHAVAVKSMAGSIGVAARHMMAAAVARIRAGKPDGFGLLTQTMQFSSGL